MSLLVHFPVVRTWTGVAGGRWGRWRSLDRGERGWSHIFSYVCLVFLFFSVVVHHPPPDQGGMHAYSCIILLLLTQFAKVMNCILRNKPLPLSASPRGTVGCLNALRL